MASTKKRKSTALKAQASRHARSERRKTAVIKRINAPPPHSPLHKLPQHTPPPIPTPGQLRAWRNTLATNHAVRAAVKRDAMAAVLRYTRKQPFKVVEFFDNDGTDNKMHIYWDAAAAVDAVYERMTQDVSKLERSTPSIEHYCKLYIDEFINHVIILTKQQAGTTLTPSSETKIAADAAEEHKGEEEDAAGDGSTASLGSSESTDSSFHLYYDEGSPTPDTSPYLSVTIIGDPAPEFALDALIQVL